MNRNIYFMLLLMTYFPVAPAQDNQEERYVQVSGIITDVNDNPVSGVSIISKRLKKGATSEYSGIYSITSTPGDTVMFRALGFKRYHTIIPPDYNEKHANVDIILEADTIEIEPVTIVPWKSYHEFIMDMTREKPVDPIIENMNDNLASIYVAIANQTNHRISAEAGYKYAMEQNFSSLATRNMYPVNNLLNPFAWSRFVKGIKNGLLKNQKFNKPTPSKVRKKKPAKD